MGYREMKNLACYVATNIYDWDKQDIEDMVEQVGCIETVVDFLREYQNRFGVGMKVKIEWALLSEE
jgi:peroxiredoxin family protein|tara:strand:- start:415 stop:612 length:198 start_codon:yes stop_codon:yes gene_type:complete